VGSVLLERRSREAKKHEEIPTQPCAKVMGFNEGSKT
jgi:hypothetical protein